MHFLLVHSPVVGPSTWEWVAEALRSANHDVQVPDLTAAAEVGDPRAYASAVVAALEASPEPPIVVGHSGAGPVLPLVAAELPGRPRLLVFVDAGAPPCEGAFVSSHEIIGVMRGLATDGVLPRWSEWWGEGALEALIPDEPRRQRVERELPRVPLRFYETPVAMPVGWCALPCAYVLVSDAYREEAAHAAALGWPVVERPGMHLDIVNDGEGFAALVLQLAAG